jgi:Tfp pilus assembly protein PilZ
LKGTDRFVVDDVVCAVHGATLKVANISVGGLFAATRSAPPVGEMLEMDVELKGRPPFRVTGKVAWINEAEEPKAPDLPQGFGLKIVKIALPDKVALLDFLKRASPTRLKGPTRSR